MVYCGLMLILIHISEVGLQAHTGYDTCSASLAVHALLPLKVLLDFKEFTIVQ